MGGAGGPADAHCLLSKHASAACIYVAAESVRLVQQVAGAPAHAPAPVAEEAPDEDTDEVRATA